MLDTQEIIDDDAVRLEELSTQPILLTITPDESAGEAASESPEAPEPIIQVTDNNNTDTAEKISEPVSSGSSLKPRAATRSGEA